MGPTHEDFRGEERGELEEPPRRSIFAAPWYRVLLAVVVLAVVVVVALPYLLDWWRPARPTPTPPITAQIQPQAPLAPPVTPPAPKAEEPKPQPGPPPAKPEPPPAAAPPAPSPKVAVKAPEKPEAKKPAEERVPTKAPAKGEYWIQVGAFKGPTNAERLAAELITQKYPVRQVKRAAPDQPAGGSHEVLVAGASRDEVNAKLPGKDYQAEAVGADVVIRPALGLKDAVILAKELTGQGFTVRIRRAGAVATLHVVQVGGFPDRERAQAVQKDLESKGFPGFIRKGEGR